MPLDMDVGTSSLHELGTDLLQIRVLPDSRLHGVFMNELRLPLGATPGLLAVHRSGRLASWLGDTGT